MNMKLGTEDLTNTTQSCYHNTLMNTRPQSNFNELATHITRDTMPREVAIAMLTAPKARLTNTQRKRCRESLVRIFISPAGPLVRNRADGLLYSGVGCTEAQAEFNLVIKMGGFSFAQLHRHKRVTTKQRENVQTEYLRLQDVPEGENSKQRALRVYQCAVLEFTAAQLDERSGAVDDELDR